MNLPKMLAIPAVILALAACGNFEWFPKTVDTTPPNVTASILGKAPFTNTTTHVSAFPATVVFAANEPATIYFTTDNSSPSTSSPSVIIASTVGVNGPTIISNTILKYFGIDATPQKNQSATQIVNIKSP